MYELRTNKSKDIFPLMNTPPSFSIDWCKFWLLEYTLLVLYRYLRLIWLSPDERSWHFEKKLTHEFIWKTRFCKKWKNNKNTKIKQLKKLKTADVVFEKKNIMFEIKNRKKDLTKTGLFWETKTEKFKWFILKKVQFLKNNWKNGFPQTVKSSIVKWIRRGT